jgi:hypothetical protein
MYPHGLWSLLLQEERQSLGQYDLYCGHFYRYLEDYLRISLTTFTFLRHPIDRAYSHYCHIVRDTHHYFHDRAHEKGSFMAFLRDPLTRPLFSNFQTRALSATFEPAMLHPEVDGDVGPYWLERQLETAPSGMSEADELIMAKDWLDRCSFVGITERMNASTELLGKLLGLHRGIAPARRNVNPETTVRINEDELQLLIELNQCDLSLYEHGVALFRRRLAMAVA